MGHDRDVLTPEKVATLTCARVANGVHTDPRGRGVPNLG